MVLEAHFRMFEHVDLFPASRLNGLAQVPFGAHLGLRGGAPHGGPGHLRRGAARVVVRGGHLSHFSCSIKKSWKIKKMSSNII